MRSIVHTLRARYGPVGGYDGSSVLEANAKIIPTLS